MASPVLVQTAFRGRNDDGNQTGATWKSASNNQNFSQNVDTTFRLRIAFAETNGRNATNSYTVYASYQGGSYFEVTTSTSYVILVDSSNVTDDEVTTAQLGLAGSFTAGRIDENNAISPITINSSYTECEFVLQLKSADVSNGQTVAFRVYANDSPLNTYNFTPTVTAIAVTQVNETASAAKSLGASVTNQLSAAGPVTQTRNEGITAADLVNVQDAISDNRNMGADIVGFLVVEETLYDK